MAKQRNNYLKETFLLISFAGLGISYSVWHAPSQWPHESSFQQLTTGEITYPDAQSIQPIWIDARPLAAFQNGTLPAAIHLNQASWDAQLPHVAQQWLTTSQPIVVFCQAWQCHSSREIASQLRENFPEAEIYSLKGGWPPAQ